MDGDIPGQFLCSVPGHVPVDRDGQRVGVVHNAHVACNVCSAAAVHRDAVEVVGLVFQNQGFSARGIDGIGGNRALIRLGDAAVCRLQRQIFFHALQILRGHRAVQRQIVRSGERCVSSGGDVAQYRFFHDRSGAVLFFFPSHVDGAGAFRNELVFRADVSKDQRAVLDVGVVHAFDIGGLRRDVHRSAVVQDADCILPVILPVTHDAGCFVRDELQFLSGVDVGVGDLRIGAAHQEAIFAAQGNRVFREHGAQAENIVLHILDEHILVGARLGQIPGKGYGQRLVRRADALFAAGDDQVLARDIGLVGSIVSKRVGDALRGIQAHVARCTVLRGVDGVYVDGGVLARRIGSARHGDVAARLYVQRAFFHSAAFLIRFVLQVDAQRHIALDREGLHVAVGVFLDRDVGSARIHELLHVVNAVFACQVFHFNRGGLV